MSIRIFWSCFGQNILTGVHEKNYLRTSHNRMLFWQGVNTRIYGCSDLLGICLVTLWVWEDISRVVYNWNFHFQFKTIKRKHLVVCGFFVIDMICRVLIRSDSIVDLILFCNVEMYVTCFTNLKFKFKSYVLKLIENKQKGGTNQVM